MSGTNRRVESLVIVDPEGNLQPFHFIDHYRENDQFYCILRHYNEIKIFKLVEKDGESVLFMAPLAMMIQPLCQLNIKLPASVLMH
ncbi:hypothetical protein JOD82_005533 [Paenibacillus sp. 1182]|uniref:hypothetical protein n=1 Tax=Paenibacillus sp. 1182 TaxID=2806565 RepID=UPI000F911F29|nr:hypothetical protein [Paenibacillus sp. 1182]MBP1312387.1 hypothetical protein [Paenibacillus sp. 1182]